MKDNVYESDYSEGKGGPGLRTRAQEGNPAHPKGKEIRDLGSRPAVEMSGSGSRLGGVGHSAAWNEGEGDGEIEVEDDEDEDGEEEQSDSDSYISDPTISTGKDTVCDRYLQRKEDRYPAESR
jgi:hypothetical protein